MNIAASSAKQTVLNSLLNESAFAKVQSALNLNEEGLAAECKAERGKDGALFSESMRFSFSPFRFEGTEAETQSGRVLFVGKGFGGRTLLAILQGSNKAEAARAVFTYSACVKQAMAEGRSLPANGAGGVLFKWTKGSASLLFLPEQCFEFSARNAGGKDCALLQGLWQDKNLSGVRAAAFVRAAAVYQALSESLPFPAEDLEARQADILDARYLPLKDRVNGVDQDLSALVSYALEYGSADFEEKRKESGLGSSRSAEKTKGGAGSEGESGPARKGADSEMTKIEWLDKDFPLGVLARELGLNPDGSAARVERKSELSQKEFEERAKKLLQKKSARAGASRTLRRNRAVFIAGLFFVAAAAFFARSLWNDREGRPTTISLGARETAEVFFSGLHNMDTIAMQASSKGREARSFVDSIGNLYVASKMRDAFAQTVGTVTPEMYVYRSDLADKWIYGITNFSLGEDEADLTEADNRKRAPLRRQKPLPLPEADGTEKTLRVRYYLVHNEGQESDISAEEVSGTVGLLFSGRRWRAVSFDLRPQKKIFPMEEFLADRKEALEQAGGDALIAAAALKEKYEWIPGAKEMAAARIECETRMKKDD